MRVSALLLVLTAGVPLSGNALRHRSINIQPQGGNDTAWYRYKQPGSDAHPHLGDSWTGDVVQDIVAGHNSARARVGLGSLYLDPELTHEAERVVRGIATSGGCQIYHSSTSSRMYSASFEYVGENLYKVIGMNPTGRDIADAWYAERSDYRFGTVGDSCTKACYGRSDPPCQTGHFTQMMWGKSRAIGCAVSECDSEPGTHIAVCQYGEGGNIVGDEPFTADVATALELSSNVCSATSSAFLSSPAAVPIGVLAITGLASAGAAYWYSRRAEV